MAFQRWTIDHVKLDPTCIQEMKRITDPRESGALEQEIDWSKGQPHYSVSVFLSYQLRGLNPNLAHLLDDEGLIDIDRVMAEYIPSSRYICTPRLMAEVIRHNSKNRYTIKFECADDGPTRVLIGANQGHFGLLAIDLTKTCTPITAENMPSHCLHATPFRNWRMINGSDGNTNGLFPGGLERDQNSSGKPKRREVHCASKPPSVRARR